MKNLNIPNKFQALIEADHVQCYAEQERIGKSIVLSPERIHNILLPAIVDGAQSHVMQRERAVRKKVVDRAVEATAEALYDPHFRKQRNYGPSQDEIRAKVKRAYSRKEPITLVSLMFTRKNVCALKRSGDDIAALDLAEIISIVHLNSFAELIERFYPYGVRYTILSEGIRFLRAFELPNERVHLYQSRLAGWAKRLALRHLKIMDYEQFLLDQLSPEQWENRVDAYDQARHLYRSLMEPIFDPADMATAIAKAIACDPIADPYNTRNNFVPLWDSIKNSLAYPEIATIAKVRGTEYTQLYRALFRNLFEPRTDPAEENVRQLILKKSWNAAIEHNARVYGDMQAGIDVAALVSDTAFRATINPKPNSPHLGIYSIRETTSRVQPWHGTAYLRTDGQGRLLPTVLSKLEIEGIGGIPACISSPHDHPFFYVDPGAVLALQSSAPLFNMSTR